MEKQRRKSRRPIVKESEKARRLTDEFVQKIIEYKDKKTKELDPIEGIEKHIKDYGREILELEDPEFAYAFIYLRKKVVETGNEALIVSSDNINIDVKLDIKLQIAKGVLTSSPSAAVHHRDILSLALTEPLDLRIKYGFSFQIEAYPKIEKAPITRGLHSAIKEESRGRNFKPTFGKLTYFR